MGAQLICNVGNVPQRVVPKWYMMLVSTAKSLVKEQRKADRELYNTSQETPYLEWKSTRSFVQPRGARPILKRCWVHSNISIHTTSSLSAIHKSEHTVSVLILLAQANHTESASILLLNQKDNTMTSIKGSLYKAYKRDTAQFLECRSQTSLKLFLN